MAIKNIFIKKKKYTWHSRFRKVNVTLYIVTFKPYFLNHVVPIVTVKLP